MFLEEVGCGGGEQEKEELTLSHPPFRPLGGWDRASCSPEQAASVLSLVGVEGTEILCASSSGPWDDG